MLRLSRWPHRFAHHRPRRLPSRDFDEPGAVVYALRAEPHRVVCDATATVDRIGLQEARTAGACIFDRAFEHRFRNLLTPRFFRRVKANDRPDRLIVDRFHDRRVLETAEIFARAERNPRDRLAIAVTDQSRRDTAIDER